MNEKQFLEDLFEDYITSDDSPYLRNMRELEIKEVKQYMRPGGVVLELGCEIGYMTSMISPLARELDVVEGSTQFINEAKKRNLPNVKFYNCLFEEFAPKQKYDYVFMSHVLEHLQNPQQTLGMVRSALAEGGKLFVVVPNAKAMSRQLALKMGIIKDLYGLTPNDVRGGHRRVYDSRTLAAELQKAKLCYNITGLLFKPFADFQMDVLIENEFLTQKHLDGLALLGRDYPEECGALFAVCVND